MGRMRTIRVVGHTLRNEGQFRFYKDANDEVQDYWLKRDSSVNPDTNPTRAACTCGELSPDHVTSQTKAKAWHRDHKINVLRCAGLDR